MNPHLLGAFLTLALSASAGTSSAVPRPDLGRPLADWQRVHGQNWRVITDEQTGFAQLLHGGNAPSKFAPKTDADFAALAPQSVVDTLALHGLDPHSLLLERALFLPLGQVGSGDKETVRLRQQWNGVRVVGGFLNLLYSAEGALLSLQSTGLPGITSFDTLATLDARAAQGLARAAFQDQTGVPADTIDEPELVIDPIPSGGQRSGRLAWLVRCMWQNPDGEPIGRELSIDAHSGALLRSATTVHTFDVSGTVNALSSPGLLPDIAANPASAQTMESLKCTAGANTVFTDASGNFNFVGLNVSTAVTFAFVGTYASVANAAGAAYTSTQTLPPNQANAVTLNSPAATLVTAQANAFRVANMMRDFVRGINPNDNMANFVTVANVNQTSTCNAFYNGTSINFYKSGGGCPNTAYSTIVSHEQGHWMNDRYGTGNGSDGMGEGNADVWSMYIHDTPIVGANFSGNNYIRTGTNTRQFCGDTHPACYGEVHNDGEVWMGAAWKVRNNLNTSLGNTQGDLTANTLFLGWMNAYNQTQIKSIIETQWMTLDDDNGNISDGTPHFSAIDTAFRTQGFPGLVVSCPAPTTFCVAAANSYNANGATLTHVGSNQISINNFQLMALNCPPNKSCLYFYGQDTSALAAFGNGFRCINGPLYRLPIITSNAFGDALFPLDLNSLPAGGQISAGQTWGFQLWYRDPDAGGANFNASEGLSVPWCL